MSDGGAVLLTGATGVLGDALLAELDGLESPPQVVALTHRAAGRRRGVSYIAGDITRPRLGLTRRDFTALARRTSTIVHAAGATNYDIPLSEMRTVNVDGTRHVLDLAALADCPVYYTSTVGLSFEDGLAGTASEQTAEQFSPRNYMATKHEAEQLLNESSTPTSILRITWVTGDSRSGQVKRFQGLYLLAQTLLLDAIPLIPANETDRVDFLPQDVIARAIWFMVDRGHSPPLTWLTAGRDALFVEEVLRAFVDYAASIGIEMEPPRFASPDIIDRLIRPVFLQEFPAPVRRRFEQLLGLVGSLAQPFPSSLNDLRASGLDLQFSPRDALLAALRFWGDRKRITARHQARALVGR